MDKHNRRVLEKMANRINGYVPCLNIAQESQIKMSDELRTHRFRKCEGGQKMRFQCYDHWELLIG